MIQQLVNGIQLGAIYALFAIGFTVIFGVHRILNLAQGTVLTCAALVAYAAAVRFHTGFVITILIGMAAGAVLSVLVDTIAFRPLRALDAPPESALVTSIGVSLILESIAQQATHTQLERYPASVFHDSEHKLFSIQISSIQLTTVAVSLVLAAALMAYLRYTSAGRQIRAVSADARTATLLGIRPGNIYLQTFAFCGAIAGAAGVLIGISVHSLGYTTGDQYLLLGITAIIVGGMGSVLGAIIAGFAVGIIEALTIQYASTSWSFAAPFILLFVMLLVRPAGLLGTLDPRATVGRSR